jgi:hypothetical protein
MSDDDQGGIQDNYRGNYTRLVDAKRAYDPTTSSTTTRISSREHWGSVAAGKL